MASKSHTETQSHVSHVSDTNHNVQHRRKLSLRQQQLALDMRTSDSEDHEGLCHHDHDHEGLKSHHQHQPGSAHTMDASEEKNISISTASRHAEQTVAPFLAKHIPTQYNPLGHTRPPQKQPDSENSSSTKFCYRHRPDLKCRRQANEPSMEQLQNVGGEQQAHVHVPILT